MLIPLSIVLVAGAMVAFLWAVRSGQYDDLDRDADAALEDPAPAPSQPSTKTAIED